MLPIQAMASEAVIWICGMKAKNRRFLIWSKLPMCFPKATAQIRSIKWGWGQRNWQTFALVLFMYQSVVTALMGHLAIALGGNRLHRS